MTRRLVVITELIAPYRIPLFNALAQNPDLSSHVIFLSETDPNLRQWRVYREDVRFSNQVLPSWRKRIGKFNFLVNWNVTDALRAAQPDLILCGGYSYVASWQALIWARLRGIPFLLWSESNVQDRRGGHAPVELLKTEFLNRCNGFIVSGQSARDYLLFHNIRGDRIFVAPNAVDNDLFSSRAADVRRASAEHRRNLGLPDRYALFVGRLVREKGVFELLSAYSKLDLALRRDISLVFLGDGPARQELQEQAAAVSPGRIMFPGFVHREDLPAYYTLAQFLVLPTYTDTWGLVVNEAMACGLPIILSDAAGCARDLVTPGWNGLLVPPREISELAAAIRNLTIEPETCIKMGARSAARITDFSPLQWSRSIAATVSHMVTDVD